MQYLPKINPAKETDKILNFIKSTFNKTGKKRAILGISGGIDSTTSLMLTVKALKPVDVYCLFLPAKFTLKKDFDQIKALVKLAKIPESNFAIVNISSIVQKSWRIIKHYSILHKSLPPAASRRQPGCSRLRLANLSARSRMMVIFDHAKLLDALVVGTENLSEHVLGYFTRFGDEASDLEPIRHLYKTQVYQLAKHLKIPQKIIKQPPTAGLWFGQTDEKELGFSYQKADPILYLYNERKTREETVKLGFKKKLVDKVLDRVGSNRFKKEAPYSPLLMLLVLLVPLILSTSTTFST